MDTPFAWSQECNASLEGTNRIVTSHNLIELFDPAKPIMITTDASSYGIGAVW